MAPLSLDKDFLTGVPAMDDEHRALAEAINALVEAEHNSAPASVANALMDQLIVLSTAHFAHEEEWMRAGGCVPEFLDKHIAAHQSFIEQLSRTRQAMAAGGDFRHLVNFLTRWATHHILGMDQSAARQIRLIQNGHEPSQAYFEQRPPASEVPTASMLDAMSSLYRIIAERNDTLADLNQNLEQQVLARTEALTETNRKLLTEHQALRDAMQALEATQKRLLESEHKRSNEARRHMEFFLSQIIDGDPVPTLVIDAEHRITHWNKACAVIAGLPAEEMLGTKEQWRAFYPEARPILADLIVDGALEADLNTHYHDIFRRSKTVADAFEAESFFPRLGVDGRWLSFTAAPIRDAEGRIIGAIETLQDVTERRRAEEALRDHQEQLAAEVASRTSELKEANNRLAAEQSELTALLAKVDEAQQQVLQSEKMAAIGQLAAGVAHEINNPIGFVTSNLGALRGYITHLLDLIDAYESEKPAEIAQARQAADLDFLREDLPALLDESQDGLDRVRRIVQDLKDFSRVDQAEWQHADLNAAMESTLNVVRNELKYKADVIVELGNIPEIDCVPAQLNQVFMNLLVNAAQAIPERGKIFVRSGVDRNYVWFEVEDTGQGMNDETCRRIFEPFFTTKPVGKGTGLGLSISYDIVVKRHKGMLDVRSKPGVGTCFRITLPMAAVMTS